MRACGSVTWNLQLIVVYYAVLLSKALLVLKLYQLGFLGCSELASVATLNRCLCRCNSRRSVLWVDDFVWYLHIYIFRFSNYIFKAGCHLFVLLYSVLFVPLLVLPHPRLDSRSVASRFFYFFSPTPTPQSPSPFVCRILPALPPSLLPLLLLLLLLSFVIKMLIKLFLFFLLIAYAHDNKQASKKASKMKKPHRVEATRNNLLIA